MNINVNTYDHITLTTYDLIKNAKQRLDNALSALENAKNDTGIENALAEAKRVLDELGDLRSRKLRETAE